MVFLISWGQSDTVHIMSYLFVSDSLVPNTNKLALSYFSTKMSSPILKVIKHSGAQVKTEVRPSSFQN